MGDNKTIEGKFEIIGYCPECKEKKGFSYLECKKKYVCENGHLYSSKEILYNGDEK